LARGLTSAEPTWFGLGRRIERSRPYGPLIFMEDLGPVFNPVGPAEVKYPCQK